MNRIKTSTLTNIPVCVRCRSTAVCREIIDICVDQFQEYRKNFLPGINSFLDDVQYDRIDVRRGHILNDTWRAFKQGQFTARNILKVRFLGEPAVDDGGPRREYLGLLVRELFTSSLIVTTASGILPNCSIKDVVDKKFLNARKIISTAFMQEGPPTTVFPK